MTPLHDVIINQPKAKSQESTLPSLVHCRKIHIRPQSEALPLRTGCGKYACPGLEWWGSNGRTYSVGSEPKLICRMIVLPPGCDAWRARPDGQRHELYLSPRGQMRIGQPDVDRAD